MIILEKDNLSKYKISFLNDDFLYWPLPCVKRLKSKKKKKKHCANHSTSASTTYPGRQKPDNQLSGLGGSYFFTEGQVELDSFV